MISSISELRKFMNLVQQETMSDQLFEMANVTSRRHGIENVVIWVGMAPKQRGLRIKVSNVPNKMAINDCFVVMMPSLDYDPTQVASWIGAKTIKQILEWVTLNQQLLYDYETGIIHDTDQFLDSISKVD